MILSRVNSQTSIASKAKVFDQKHQSERAMFEYKLSVEAKENGTFEANRIWLGLTSPYIAKETVVWCPKQGLKKVEMHQPHLNESGSLAISAKQGRADLSSQKTEYKQKSKTLNFTKRPCTLLSIPFEIVHHWDELSAGNVLYFDYTVLKVQAHTEVKLTMRDEGEFKVVRVTPEKWFWRLLFGSTEYYFEGDAPKLTKIVGLLEPRDRNLRGKYVEYLGRAIFDRTVDFSMIKESNHV
ncbi:hypothetical protein [Vibrio genomosp. F10]|uniref:hypothetical protein n=1 Tax=Vibrio genomosp. F10 TaxID=723171 RepID=UPI00036580E4|nr:hypothetical protein [Vibrio genomosp. F10]OEE95274.1 hypothetical protein A1QK_15480 [Vibrio genomosp. F10 str. 9ZD137]